MKGPTAEHRIEGCTLTAVGTIAGFVPDGDRVRAAFEASRPEAVSLGVPPEDVEALDALATSGPPPEGLPTPDPQQAHLLKHLEAFGPTRIPSPDLEVAHRLAKAAGVPLVALDLDDRQHAELFTRHVGMRHIVIHNALQRRILKRDYSGETDAYALAHTFDADLNRLKPFKFLEGERERHMGSRLREACRGKERVLAVLPASRMEGILAAATLEKKPGPEK